MVVLVAFVEVAFVDIVGVVEAVELVVALMVPLKEEEVD